MARPLRAPTRKESPNLPLQPQFDHLLQSSRELTCTAPKLASSLGRRALLVADEGAMMPRGAVTTICRFCGLSYSKDVYLNGKLISLSKSFVRRMKKRKRQSLEVNRAAIVLTCQLCNSSSTKLYYTFEAAQKAISTSSYN